MKHLQTGFDTERLRKKLLSAGHFAAVRKTYSRQFPEISDANTASFWDDKFASSDGALFPMSRARNKLIGNSIRPGLKVINLGAGNGYLEHFVYPRLAQHVEWIGTDITPHTLARLQGTYPAFRFQHASLTQLPFAEGSVDMVCLLEVLEHIVPSKTFQVLSEISRVLVKGGTAIISVPLNEGLEEMMPNNPNAHVRVYSAELLAFELAQVGLQIYRQKTLSAFGRFFVIKQLVNDALNLRQPNNIIVWAEKK